MKTTRRSVIVLVLILASCKQPGFYDVLGNAVTPVALAIAPTTATLAIGSKVSFTASGGVSPYTYAVASGPGTVNNNGEYTANASGSAVVRVKDATGSTSDAAISVSATGALFLSPAAPIVGFGGTILFVASGGTAPYTYSLGATASSPSLNASTGLYTAGFSVGTDRVIVTDSSTPSPGTVFVDVSVTGAVTNVDYTISAATPPATGVGTEAIPGGFSFTVRNNGPSDGTQAITWWTYLSDSSISPNSTGTALLSTGTTGPLASGATAVIPITGTWPPVPLVGAGKYLYFEVSAPDDLNAANDLSTAHGVSIGPADVDYSPTLPVNTGGTISGGPMGGSFTLQNAGTDPGMQTVYWTAYVSTNPSPIIDAGAIPIQSGNTSPLAGGGSTAVPFTGTWPATPATYYLKVKTSAGDDRSAGNDLQLGAAPVTTTASVVDYGTVTVALPSPLVAANNFSTTFTYRNNGTANGVAGLAWSAWASNNTTLDTGDVLVATGGASALGAGLTSSPQGLAGAWPSTPGNWYLIVTVSSPEDSASGNNLGVTASPVTTVLPNADYQLSAVNVLGASAIPGGNVNGNFMFSNTGAQNGSQPVPWKVYASTTGVLDGTEALIDSGTTTPLNGLASSLLIPFSGPWPIAYGNYLVVAQVSAPDDPATVNNAAANATPTPVGITDETVREPDNDAVGHTDAVDLGVALRPGMSVHVFGSMSIIDMVDVLRFNSWTTSVVSASMTWSGSHGVTLYFGDSLGFTASQTVASGTAVSLVWNHGSPGTNFWIIVSNDFSQNIGGYELTLNGVQ
jgi:hypothetical protein